MATTDEVTTTAAATVAASFVADMADYNQVSGEGGDFVTNKEGYVDIVRSRPSRFEDTHLQRREAG